MRNHTRLAAIAFDLAADDDEGAREYERDRKDWEDLHRQEYQRYLAWKHSLRLQLVEQD